VLFRSKEDNNANNGTQGDGEDHGPYGQRTELEEGGCGNCSKEEQGEGHTGTLLSVVRHVG
jgi:hypothetical protein